MNQDTTIPVLDTDDLMDRCLSNAEFAQRILSRFQERCVEDLASLEEAVQAGKVDEAVTLAHRIKGAAGNASASSMRAVAAEIEETARQGSLNLVSPMLHSLQREWTQFQVAAARFGPATPSE